MVDVCFYFQVHQPFRLRKYSIFEIGKGRDDSSSLRSGNNMSVPDYFDHDKNEKTMQKVAGKCYLPMNNLLLGLLNEIEDFKASFSITGTALEQF
ncbi:MAG: hypothetical protein NT001_06245, partial [Candidatus Woesearchaeota archaeon]|nr:hypothetical protein [Candidatus Woesearchaeota archaeon]